MVRSIFGMANTWPIPKTTITLSMSAEPVLAFSAHESSGRMSSPIRLTYSMRTSLLARLMSLTALAVTLGRWSER